MLGATSSSRTARPSSERHTPCRSDSGLRVVAPAAGHRTTTCAPYDPEPDSDRRWPGALLGLVSEVVDGDAVGCARGLATSLAAGPSQALGQARRLLRSSWSVDRATSGADESRTIGSAVVTLEGESAARNVHKALNGTSGCIRRALNGEPTGETVRHRKSRSSVRYSGKEMEPDHTVCMGVLK